MYSTKTRSEDPTLAKASDAIKATQSTKPINQLNIQPADQMKKVINPTRKLSTLLNGGYTYQTGGPVYSAYKPGPTVTNPDRPQNRKSQAEIENDAKMAAWEANRYKNYQADSTAFMNKLGPQIRQYVPGKSNIVNPTNVMQHKLDNTNKVMYQMGGTMPAEQIPNESNDHMNQLMSGNPQAAQEEMQEQAPQMGQGQMPVQITQLEPALQQMFMQLSPEQQQEILSLPPDQIEIALMTLMQQMSGQGGQPQPAQPQMGGMSEVPAGVMEQMG